jgi:hypothetical protein
LEEEDEKVCKIKKGKENHSLFTAIPPNSFLSSAFGIVDGLDGLDGHQERYSVLQKILGYVYMTSQHDVVLKLHDSKKENQSLVVSHDDEAQN